MLAFYLYPFVENHKVIEYTRADLKDPDKVGKLFDYCQILEAYITKSGWDFLINHYGYDGLYDIDKRVDGLVQRTLKNLNYILMDKLKAVYKEISLNVKYNPF